MNGVDIFVISFCVAFVVASDRFKQVLTFMRSRPAKSPRRGT